MSNFICSECGMTNIDCGYAGYKTPKEIELEKENKRLQEQLKSANNAMKAMLPFAHNYPKERIEKYLRKWGVK